MKMRCFEARPAERRAAGPALSPTIDNPVDEPESLGGSPAFRRTQFGAGFEGKPLFAFEGNQTTNFNPINHFRQKFEGNTGAKSAGVFAAV
jgi:hypothetical protein